MNLKSRLSRVEDAVGINSDDVCNCESNLPTKFDICYETVPYDPYSTGQYVPYQDSEESRQREAQAEKTAEVVEYCEDCKKRVNKQMIVVQFVGVSIKGTKPPV
jgi:hypothetical protein